MRMRERGVESVHRGGPVLVDLSCVYSAPKTTLSGRLRQMNSTRDGICQTASAPWMADATDQI